MENVLYNNTNYFITIKKVYTNEIFTYSFINNQTLNEFKNTLCHHIERDFSLHDFHFIDVDYNSIHGITNTPCESAPPISYLDMLNKIKTKLIDTRTNDFYFYVSNIPHFVIHNCRICNAGVPIRELYGCTHALCQPCFVLGNGAGYEDCEYCNRVLQF